MSTLREKSSFVLELSILENTNLENRKYSIAVQFYNLSVYNQELFIKSGHKNKK